MKLDKECGQDTLRTSHRASCIQPLFQEWVPSRYPDSIQQKETFQKPTQTKLCLEEFSNTLCMTITLNIPRKMDVSFMSKKYRDTRHRSKKEHRMC